MTWKKIKHNENYSISENGKVRNDNTKKLKRPYINKQNGYMYVDLWENNKSTKCPIHRLLAETFIPNPESKPCVDHKDGNSQNNSLSNLRWASYSENNSRFGTIGVRSEAIIVKRYDEKRKKRGGGHIAWGKVISEERYDRIKDAADKFNVTIGNISNMLKSGEIGRRGKMRGFKFEYAER